MSRTEKRLRTVVTPLDLEDAKRFFLAGLSGWSCPAHDRLAERVHGEVGRFWTLAPEGIEVERLSDFRSGGLLPVGETRSLADGTRMVAVPTTTEELAAWVLTRELDGLRCLLYDAIVSPGDSCLVGERGVRTRGEQVYNEVALERATTEELLYAIKTTSAIFHSLGVVSRVGGECPPPSEITAAELTGFATHAEIAFQGAYDGESFVVWQPGD